MKTEHQAPEMSGIFKEPAEDWIFLRAGEAVKSRAHRLTCIRQFSEYLNNLGYGVHFLPEQIRTLFAAADNKRFCDKRRNIQNSLPVTFRMLHGCGLRVSEALELQVKDVNLTDHTMISPSTI